MWSIAVLPARGAPLPRFPLLTRPASLVLVSSSADLMHSLEGAAYDVIVLAGRACDDGELAALAARLRPRLPPDAAILRGVVAGEREVGDLAWCDGVVAIDDLERELDRLLPPLPRRRRIGAGSRLIARFGSDDPARGVTVGFARGAVRLALDRRPGPATAPLVLASRDGREVSLSARAAVIDGRPAPAHRVELRLLDPPPAALAALAELRLWEASEEDGQRVFALRGDVDAGASLAGDADASLAGLVARWRGGDVLDLGGVEHVSRAALLALAGALGPPVRARRVAPALARQLLRAPELARVIRVESAWLPLRCAVCRREALRLVDGRSHAAPECLRCRAPLRAAGAHAGLEHALTG